MKTLQDFKTWYLETPIDKASHLEDIYNYFKQDEFISIQDSIKDLWPKDEEVDAAFWEAFEESRLDDQEDAWIEGTQWVKEKLLGE